jgi:restriction system protein
MGRRKSSPAEDLIDLVALMPWWAGVALAGVSYLVLHNVAGQEVARATQADQLGAVMAQSVWRAAASLGQYAVPFICLAGAALSAWRRRQRKELLASVTQGSNAAGTLDGMSWREFEMLVGEAFRLQGYRVAETGASGPDGGVDLVLTKGTDRFLVQCKQWKAFRVGVTVIRELYGVMAAKGAAGGFVVTSGRFTQEAERFASGTNVVLIDGPRLHALIRQAQQTVSTAPSEPSALVAQPFTVERVPSCPVCAKAMIRRTARRGASAGRQFWGCTGYPDCRGLRQIG